MDLSEAVKVLRNNPMLAKLDASKLKLIAFASERLTYEDGEVLFHQGEPGCCAYLIIEGKVIVSGGRDGDEVTVSTLGKNDLFGEMAIFLNSPRSATIKANGHLEVMRIDGDMFLKLVTENKEAALGVMQALSEKLARATEDQEKLGKMLRALELGS